MNPIERLNEWFRPLKSEQAQILISKTAFIPMKALGEIVERIIDESPPNSAFPTLSKIIQGWEVWKMENPAKIVHLERTKCDECGPCDPIGSGLIHARKKNDSGRWIEYSFRCAMCRNWIEHVSEGVMPSATKSSLASKGYEVWPWFERGKEIRSTTRLSGAVGRKL